MKSDIKPIKLVIIITDRRDGKKLFYLLTENGYNFHDAFLGRGTAPDDISAVLGLGEPEKVLYTCFLDTDRASGLLKLLNNEFFNGDLSGLAFTLPVNSASNMEIVRLVLSNN